MITMERPRRDKNSEPSRQCGKMVQQHKTKSRMHFTHDSSALRKKLKETLEHPPAFSSELAIHKGMLPILWLANVKQVSELWDPEKSKKYPCFLPLSSP